MNFIIKKENLLPPIQKLNSIILINKETPIINNILFNIQNNKIYLISTNSEIQLITKIKFIKIFNTGRTTVSGKKILNIIRSFPKNSEIRISINPNNMHISCKNIYFILTTSHADQFPVLKNEKNIISILIPQKKFKKILYNTYFSMAKEDIRNYLNGMYIECINNIIYAVSTDGYRISISYIKIINISNIPAMIIPRKAILELIKLLNDTNNIFKITISSRMIIFNTDKYILSSRLIDNEFPDYKNLLTNHFDKKIIINRLLLQQALIRTSYLVNKKIQGIKLNIHNNTCIISSQNEKNEQAKEKFNIQNSYESIELTMNINYILDVVNTITNSEIIFLLNNSKKMIYIENINSVHSTYIIMPLIL